MADETTAVLEEPIADGATESVPAEATSTDPPTKRRARGTTELPAQQDDAEPSVVYLDEPTADPATADSATGDSATGDSASGDDPLDEAPPAAIRPIARLGGDPDVLGTQLDYRPNAAPNVRVQPHPSPTTVPREQPRPRAGPMTVDAVAFPRSTDPLPHRTYAAQLEAWLRKALETPPIPPTLDDPEPS